MLFFYMSDFVGNDSINLFGFKELEKGAGNKDVAEFFDQTHHAGGYHSATEYWPVENVGIFHSRFLAQVFDPSSIIPCFKGFASPEFLDHRRTYNCNRKKKNKEIDHLAFRGGEKTFRQFKGQSVDYVGNSGQQQPRDKYGNRK